MATIDQLIAAVQAAPIENGDLTLSATDFSGITVAESFFASVVGAQSLTLTGAAKDPGTETITVTGNGTVLGYSGVDTTLTFATTPGDGTATGPAAPLGKGATITWTGTLAADKPQPLPVISWIEISGASVSSTIAEPFNAVTYGFAASLVLSGDTTGTVPISLTQADNGLWTLAIAGEAGQSVTAEQLVALLGGAALTEFLPSQLVDLLEGLALSDLEISFDPATKTVGAISAGLTATNGWPMASGLSLEPGLHVALSVQDPLDERTRDVFAAVTGTVVIDGVDVPVFVQVDASGGTSTWLVGLDPASGGVTLPSLSGLFTLAGGASFTQSLPGALANLPAIQIDPLLIGFTLSPSAFQSFDFGATTVTAWPVIDHFLTVDKLTFKLTLAGLDTGTKTVGGSLMAVLEITDDVWLYFSCVKDPSGDTWTFSGGLPPGKPLNLTDLVAKLLSPFVTIPASAPQLVLDTVDLTMVPGTSMTFTAGSQTPWPLLTGLTLDSFTLEFDYTSGAPTPFSGSLNTALTVAQVDLEISAGLDTGGSWTFSGKTKPGEEINVVNLVNDLTGTFGVPAVPADALGGLTISNLSTSFATAAAGRPGAFHFGCDGSFDIAGTELDITVAIDLTSAATGYTGTFTGELELKKDNATTETIDVTFAGSTLTADWKSAPGHGLSLTDLVSCFDLDDLPAIPEAVDLTLVSMSFAYDVSKSSLAIGATTASGDKAVFLSAPVGAEGAQEQRFGFAVDLPLDVTLANLPLVGDKIPDADQLGIPDLGAWVVSGDLAGTGATSDAATLNAIVPKGYPTLPEITIGAGLLLFGKLLLGSDVVPLELPLSSAQTTAPSPVLRGAPAAEALQRVAATTPALQAAAATTVLRGEVVGGNGGQGGNGGGTRAAATAPVGGGRSTGATVAGNGGNGRALTGNGHAGNGHGNGTPVALGGNGAVGAGSGGATTKWFSVQRSFGVFSFQRIGVQYDSDGGGTLYFLLDAGIELGPLQLTTQGLGIGSPLTSFDPKFHLDGLGLSYDQPPLEIAGGFLAIPSEQLAPDVAFQYDGFASIKLSSFSLSAIGSYAQMTAGDPSLFLFAQLEAPLGGPPAFFVTGLMAGFGYNRDITMPKQDEVLGFPLLVLGSPPAPGKTAPPQSMTDVLAILEGTKPITPGGEQKQWIAPQTGEYWLAVGLEFTSFELVTTKAMLIAQFGNELAFALLGISTLRLPQGAPDAETYAYVELELMAVLKPTEGIFGITAVLGPASYVIDPACHLTGGFAFFVWFGENPNAGQFVITLGGYHPAFNKPDYFPSEPRLGFSWTVSDEVAIKGEAYFALTASCVMAGGGLDITFQSGNLKAWFTAQMDVLISWNPFSFQAYIGISIGVSYKLDLGFVSKTISVSLGASLSLWGPPTGGTVTVHLWIISFTVDFGAPQGQASNEPLLPAGFSSLLPAPPTLLAVSASSGLTQTLDSGSWAVRASAFAFQTNSAIPNTTLAHGGPNGTTTTEDTGYALNVRPMNLTGTEATHTVTIARKDGTDAIDLTTWAPEAVTRAVPESLWGVPQKDAKGNFTQLPQEATAATVPDAPVGASFTCPAPVLGPSPGVTPEPSLAFEPVSAPGAKAVPTQTPLQVGAVPSTVGLPAAAANSLAAIEQVAGQTATTARNPILAALAAAQPQGQALYDGPTSDLSGLAGLVNDAFANQPMLAGSGA